MAEDSGESASLERLAEIVVTDARNAFRAGTTRPLAWRVAQLQAMKSMLNDHAAAFSAALRNDLGKGNFQANFAELDPLRNSCDFFLKKLKKLMKPTRAALPWYMKTAATATIAPEPLGVVLIFAAWNYPLLLALDPLIAAIAAGNAVVLKPAEAAKSTCAILKQLLPQYLDARVVKVFEATKLQCGILLQLKFDKIFYTGSPNVGRIIMKAAAQFLTPVTLELGGKNPVIVDSATDICVAARRIAATKWASNSGQTCVAPDYVLVHSSVTQIFVEAVEEAIISFNTPLPQAVDAEGFSHVIDLQAFQRLQNLLEEVKDFVSFSLGPSDEEKLTIMPTIVLNPPLESQIMQEEIFGPILPVIEVESMEKAIDFVNSKPEPLAVYLFTNNKELAAEVSQRISSGSTVINDVGVQFNVESLPFGGFGESGMGSYHGRFGFDNFSHYKPTLATKITGDDPVRYPPHTEKAKAIMRACLRNKSFLYVMLIKLGLKKA